MPQKSTRRRTEFRDAVYVHPANAGLPTSSWWTKPRSRAAFDRQVEKERPRMALSSFGRTLGRLA